MTIHRRNATVETVSVPVPLKPQFYHLSRQALLHMTKDVKHHLITSEHELVFDETQPNGSVISVFCDELAMTTDTEN